MSRDDRLAVYTVARELRLPVCKLLRECTIDEIRKFYVYLMRFK